MTISDQEVKEMISEVYTDIINRPGKRSDINHELVTVKGYWCGEVLRFDVQFKRAKK